MSFYLEILCGGHWHTELSNLFSADVYSDQQISRRSHKDLVLWGSSSQIMAEQETLEGGELGTQTPSWIKPLSKSWAASAFPVECSRKWLLSRSWTLFSQERQKREAWKTRRAVEIQDDVGLRQENYSLAAVDQILWQQWWALSSEPICTDSASLKCKYHPHWGL